MNHSVKDPALFAARLTKIAETARELAKKADALRRKSESLRMCSWQLRLDSRKHSRRCR